MTELRLEAAGLEPLPLGDEFGYIVRRLDLGAASVRTRTQDRPDGNGGIDRTRFSGPRVVGLQLRVTRVAAATVAGSMTAAVDRVLQFTDPALRPTLLFTRDDGIPKQVDLVARAYSAPIESAHYVDVTLQWEGPLGFVESQEVRFGVAQASGGVLAGRAYPLVFDRVYPVSAPSGQALVTNRGNRPAYPILRLYGPIGNGTDDVTIENRTAGRSIVFSKLVIPAGEFLEVDTLAKTVLYLGSPLDNRYNLWSTTKSNWWTLLPGVNDIRYNPATFSAPAVATIEYRDAYS